MITSKKIENVAIAFETLAEQHELHQVAMEKTWVNTRPECGTVACHAGWYLIGAIGFPAARERYSRAWQHGANKMAQDLGFEVSDELEDWADQHPEIWGNEHGSRMFMSSKAFGDEELNLQKIADHWKGVAKRLRIQETGETQ